MGEMPSRGICCDTYIRKVENGPPLAFASIILVVVIGTGSAGSKIYRSSERGCSSHNLRGRISELIH
jgi:hypothetical protein